jgi:hypothetical protein
MSQLERISDDGVRELLVSVLPKQTATVNALLDELKPVWLLDRKSDRILFRAQSELGQPNEIRIGLKCTKRLQVHAYAVARILSALGKPKAERDLLLAPVNQVLDWAVGVELKGWLETRGIELPAGHVLRPTNEELPSVLLSELSARDKILGMGFFKFAIAWILLHELGHLKLRHTSQKGLPSFEQEKEADRFAAAWMAEAAADSRADKREADRLSALFGTALALLWLTIFNVFLGVSESETHPEGYDRLFQVLDQVIDQSVKQEYASVWQSVATLLFIHMWSGGYDFDESDGTHMQGDPRDEVNHLIDRMSRSERTK